MNDSEDVAWTFPGVVLRNEREGVRSHYVLAMVDDDGTLIFEFNDVDPDLDQFFGKDEVETTMKVRAEHLEKLIEELGGAPGCDVLEFLAERYSGPASYELWPLLRGSEVPIERFTW
ncbi:hypothetical protein [Glycomyces buryatensis]|uniref:Uncharacterized protein n=1 Tax=Glycomyces buryatensis TaxID=2570927 RepID=A0A4S8PYP6_9ACTN|nr:hypothetical protein [Glycomyces buryatensis]THV32904.1 hypothetical protein FAB82_26745 [Glycomyces buryatensis]